MTGIVQKKRVVVAITGATGAVYGVRLLEMLRHCTVTTHLIVSRAGWMTLLDETGLERNALRDAASVYYDQNEVGASIASGSFQHDGMVIAPCSMKTLAAVAHGFDDNLISRAASIVKREPQARAARARNSAHARASAQHDTRGRNGRDGDAAVARVLREAR